MSQITNFKACIVYLNFESLHINMLSTDRQTDRQTDRRTDRRSTITSTYMGEGNYFHNTYMYECSIIHVDCRARYIDLTIELGEHYIIGVACTQLN